MFRLPQGAQATINGVPIGLNDGFGVQALRRDTPDRPPRGGKETTHTVNVASHAISQSPRRHCRHRALIPTNPHYSRTRLASPAGMTKSNAHYANDQWWRQNSESISVSVSEIAFPVGHWILVIGRAFRIIREAFVNNPG